MVNSSNVTNYSYRSLGRQSSTVPVIQSVDLETVLLGKMHHRDLQYLLSNSCKDLAHAFIRIYSLVQCLQVLYVYYVMHIRSSYYSTQFLCDGGVFKVFHLSCSISLPVYFTWCLGTVAADNGSLYRLQGISDNSFLQ